MSVPSPLDVSLQPLSPRREMILDARPTFYWADANQPVRVVVAADDDVVWKSRKTIGQRLRYPDNGPSLSSSERYTWWLETTSRRHGQTRPASFRLPPSQLRANMAAFESEMQTLASTPEAEAMTLYLRSAYYSELGAHSAALFALQQLGAHRRRDGCGQRHQENRPLHGIDSGPSRVAGQDPETGHGPQGP